MIEIVELGLQLGLQAYDYNFLRVYYLRDIQCVLSWFELNTIWVGKLWYIPFYVINYLFLLYIFFTHEV